MSTAAQRHAWRAEWRRRKQTKDAGGSFTTDAREVRRHLKLLHHRHGRSLASIADAAGVSRPAVYCIWQGKRRTIHTHTANAILAVTPGSATAQSVDATGARRRLQALSCIGYGGQHVADLLGMTIESVCAITAGSRPRVFVSTADAVKRLHDQLWDTPPMATTKGDRIAIGQARGRARRNHWAPSAAWNDETIDNPKARPAGVPSRERAA